MDTDGLVLFGATGDLARKKIFPAIYNLERRGLSAIKESPSTLVLVLPALFS